MDKWSRKHKKCKDCKKTERKHVQQGYCTSCWSKRRYKKEKKRYKEYFANYWEENKEELTAKRKKYLSEYYKTNKKA